MQAPRSVEELAGTVVLEADRSVEDSIQRSAWAQAFLANLPDQQLANIFIFLVLCLALQSKDKQKRELSLFELQNRVFSNSRTGIANISFRDTENVVEEIFK